MTCPTPNHARPAPRLLTLPALLVLGTLAALVLAGSAFAASPAAHLELEVLANPTSFSAADTPACENGGGVVCDQFRVSAYSSGDVPASGQIVLGDQLPPGLVLRSTEVQLVRIFSGAGLGAGNAEEVLYQSGSATKSGVSCNQTGQTFGCRVSGSLAPDQVLQLRLPVFTQPGAVSDEIDLATLGGTAAAGSSVETPITVDSPPSFGLSSLFGALTDEAGEPLTQAGAHPYEYSTRIHPTTRLQPSPESQLVPTSVEDLRDAIVDLPPGLVGSAQAAPKCPQIQLTTLAGCPTASVVGYIRTEPNSLAGIISAIYNIVPEHGVAAEFGFTDILHNVHFIYASVVPGPEGYVVRASTPELPQIALSSVIATFYGDPSTRDGAAEELPPMFSMPADCSGDPLTSSIRIDSWQNPGPQDAEGPNLADPRWASATTTTPAVSGCEELLFKPTLQARVENAHADSPTGLAVNLKVPQTTGAEELATPPLRKAVISLPEGLAVNPSSANGLGACSLAQIGISASGLPDGAQPSCPEDSKIGTLELESPALPGVLQGEIYLARQHENPFGSLLAIYLVVDDPITGVLVKLAGEVRADPTSGRLTATVDDNPQLPFSELRTHFFGGNRAPLRTAAVCDTYTATSALTPWSAPQSGPPATPSSRFKIDEAAGGGEECPTDAEDEPNHPAFTAGTLSAQAGAYTPFVVHAARADGDQPITRLNVTLPKGLTGKLAGIPYCPESDIATARSREHEGGGAEELAQPACPAASEVGVVQVGAGAGPEPFYVTGHAYLTGPYKGAPLGVAIISPAVAGPFDLGDVVVRAALEVDPLTAQISAASDPIPTILDGIPLDIRQVSLEMNRPQFTLNPTNCEKTAVTGEAVGQFGTTAALTEPFQVGGCRNLAFRPKLAISLKGSTKHAGHPALKAVLTYPKQGAYANVAKAQVNLPHSEFIDQANLNKACTRPVLLAGNCPPSTVYGKAKAWTPLLGAPLEGPVYLVGGFGYKLPALVAELGGQIRVLLVGKVDSGPNHGIRNTFEAVPDAPVEKFVLEMKGGPRYSLLENSENLCGKPQKAIASFTAQNGATLKLAPKIANDCGKKRKAKGDGKRPARHRHKGSGKKR
jgi:hypothetical protein